MGLNLMSAACPDLEFYSLRRCFTPTGQCTVFPVIYLYLPLFLPYDSVGKLKLRSKDPFVYPKIDANYLSNEKDVAVLTEGIKICRKIARAQVSF